VGVFQAVILGLLFAFYVTYGLALSSRAYSVDFLRLFGSAQSLVAGKSIYAPSPVSDFNASPSEVRFSSDKIHPNLNPPLLAVLLTPLTLLGLSTGYTVWIVFGVVSGLLMCTVLWWELRQASGGASELVWLWIAFFSYFPSFVAVGMGQVTFSTLVPLVGAWLAARHGKDRWAGVLLGLAVSLKVFFALLVVFFVSQRRWRIVAWSIGATLVIALATLPVVGVRAYVEYLAAARTVTWFSNSYNASYASVITRVLGGSDNTPLMNLPRVAHGLVLFTSVVTLLWLGWAVWPTSGSGRSLERFDLSFGLSLVVMLLVSPLGWMYYFPLLIVPAYAVWRVTREGRMRAVRRGLFLAWGLSTIPTPMVWASEANDPARWLADNSLYFYALFAMFIVVARALAGVDRATCRALPRIR
jgi:hypothetical protein